MRGGEWDRAGRQVEGAGVGRGVGRRRAALLPWPAGVYPVFGYSLYHVCEVQRSASEIRRAPVQTGLTGT
jgi:hypothetical protein